PFALRQKEVAPGRETPLSRRAGTLPSPGSAAETCIQPQKRWPCSGDTKHPIPLSHGQKGGVHMANKDEETHVMRSLDQKKVPYTPCPYPHEPGVAVDGVTVAESMGQAPARVFKTLVTRGASGGYYVFDI